MAYRKGGSCRNIPLALFFRILTNAADANQIEWRVTGEEEQDCCRHVPLRVERGVFLLTFLKGLDHLFQHAPRAEHDAGLCSGLGYLLTTQPTAGER